MKDKRKKKNPAAVELGRRGGKATAAKRTPEQRREQARRAVQARWKRTTAKKRREAARRAAEARWKTP